MSKRATTRIIFVASVPLAIGLGWWLYRRRYCYKKPSNIPVPANLNCKKSALSEKSDKQSSNNTAADFNENRQTVIFGDEHTNNITNLPGEKSESTHAIKMKSDNPGVSETLCNGDIENNSIKTNCLNCQCGKKCQNYVKKIESKSNLPVPYDTEKKDKNAVELNSDSNYDTQTTNVIEQNKSSDQMPVEILASTVEHEVLKTTIETNDKDPLLISNEIAELTVAAESLLKGSVVETVDSDLHDKVSSTISDNNEKPNLENDVLEGKDSISLASSEQSYTDDSTQENTVIELPTEKAENIGMPTETTVGQKNGIQEETVRESFSQNNSQPNHVQNGSVDQSISATPLVNGNDINWADDKPELKNDTPSVNKENAEKSLMPRSNHTYIEFPSDLVGYLIGRQGKNIKSLKDKSNAEITVRSLANTDDIQILDIQGTKEAIDKALDIIEYRFPQLPLVEPEQEPLFSSPFSPPVVQPPSVPPFSYPIPEMSQLHLPEGINVEVIVSAISDCNKIFVQQYTHPTYYELPNLEQAINACYSQVSTPNLLNPVQIGLICVVQQNSMWFRAQVMSQEDEMVLLKFVDYGGFATVPLSTVRQIRADFISLPFQATSCILDSIQPLKGQVTYSDESILVLQGLLQEGSFEVFVTGYNSEGEATVQLYRLNADKTVSNINELLVEQGVASKSSQSSATTPTYTNGGSSFSKMIEKTKKPLVSC